VNIANLTLPDSMQHLTYEVANDIEAILEYALTGAVSVQMTLADMNEKTLKTLDGYTLAVIGT
jgi:predicted histidine transporter YuiF (NhaC family)